MREVKRILRKVRQLLKVSKFCLFSDESVLFHLIKEEADDYLEQCRILGVSSIEGVEDLLFHITAYFEIPESLRATTFKDACSSNPLVRTGKRIRKASERQLLEYAKFLEEVEKERAIERDYICDLLKALPMSFRI